MISLVMLFALSQPALQWAEVRQRALDWAPAIVAAAQGLEGAKSDALTAVGAFDPVFKARGVGQVAGAYPQLRLDGTVEVPTTLWGTSLFAGYRLGLGKIQDYYLERQTLDLGEVRAGVQIPILRNGPTDRRRANLEKAGLQTEVSQLELAMQRLDVERAASLRYFEWVFAGQRRRIAIEFLEVTQTRGQQLDARARAGEVAKIDALDNQRALRQREALAAQAQRSVEQAAFELSLFYRDDSGLPKMPQDEALPEAIEAPNFTVVAQKSIETAHQQRPDLLRIFQQQKSLEVELRLQLNQRLPAVDVSLSVARDLGNPSRPELEGLRQTELEVGLQLEIPLLFRAPTGRIDSTRALLRRLEAQKQVAFERVAVEVKDAQSALVLSRQRLVAAREESTVAKALEDAEKKKFELGDSNLLFVNLREQNTAEAKLRAVDALHESLRALVAYQSAIGSFSEPL
jgi:outer membrane protein, heavy metal efflux system